MQETKNLQPNDRVHSSHTMDRAKEIEKKDLRKKKVNFVPIYASFWLLLAATLISHSLTQQLNESNSTVDHCAHLVIEISNQLRNN